MSGPNDARLWAYLTDAASTAGVTDPQRFARTLVGIVRRERAANGARTWGPGESIPYDVMAVTDLDGDRWDRQGGEDDVSRRDGWKMRDHDPDEHEDRAGGWWVTPYLLDEYGPVTEVKARMKT